MSNKQLIILKNLLNEIEGNIPNKELTNSKISKVSIGWQLDHSLKVVNGICAILQKTKPEKYKRDFNLLRLILFPLAYIPRGKAKAPKTVQPPNDISVEDLHTQLEMARGHIDKISPLPKKSFFIHHIFGTLSKKQTIRFLQIHTRHHLKIVNDILKKQKTLSVSRKGL